MKAYHFDLSEGDYLTKYYIIPISLRSFKLISPQSVLFYDFGTSFTLLLPFFHPTFSSFTHLSPLVCPSFTLFYPLIPPFYTFPSLLASFCLILQDFEPIRISLTMFLELRLAVERITIIKKELPNVGHFWFLFFCSFVFLFFYFFLM